MQGVETPVNNDPNGSRGEEGSGVIQGIINIYYPKYS